MDCINFCFTLKSSHLSPLHDEIFEKDYETVYKPVIKFLCAHPDFKIALSFNGVQLDFFQRKYPEFIDILRQLIAKKQLEILGGGYYDPVFPLLLPVDRAGQIEKLTSKIRSTTGKRPRGISVCGSIWDYSLISSFNTCGMDYVLLDESLIPSDKLKFVSLFMTDKGKSIHILPLFKSLKPLSDNDVDFFIDTIKKSVGKASKYNYLQSDNKNRIVTFEFNHEELKDLLQSGWLSNFYNKVSSIKDSICFSTPSAALKNCDVSIPAYIYSGMSGDIAQWGIKPYESVKLDKRYPITIYDLFQIYPQSKALYDRMFYVSMLIHQSHGDKIRKNTAREKLWEAQNGDGFICTSKGAFVSSTYRQQAYKKLTEAEKILRECEPFKESITSFDYTGDGIKDYVCRMQRFFAVISRKGGSLRELDVFGNSGNFADNLNSVKEFEGYNDDYERGLFIDHLYDHKEFESYLENTPVGSGIFSKYVYNETKFSNSKKEIILESSALYKNRQKVNLIKRFILNSNGITVQYILKNESSEVLNAKFAVESNFAQTNFNEKDFEAFKLQILSDSRKQEIDTKTSSKELNESGKLSDVEGIWVTDQDNKITFVFEPNESCGLSFVPIVFSRPEYTSGELIPACMTFANTLFWDIELAPGMEMEKTINFSIFNQHRK